MARRLIDKLRTERIKPFPLDEGDPREYARLLSELRKDLERAAPIVADNIAEYLYAGTDKEHWDLRQDFPNVAPPFPLFWIEHRRPSLINSDEHGRIDTDLFPRAVGFLVRAEQPLVEHAEAAAGFSREERNALVITDWQRQTLRAVMKGERDPRALALAAQVRELTEAVLAGEPCDWNGVEVDPAGWDLRWVYEVTMWVEDHEGSLRGQESIYPLVVNADGNIPLTPVVGRWTRHAHPVLDALMAGSTSHLYVPLLTLTFLNCRNVELARHEPPEKLSRAHQKRHGTPLTRYRTVVVHPMRRKGRSGNGTGNRHGTGLHRVRGHFKTHGPEAPLFGKHVGTWFWEDQAVGDLEQGRVVSDYRVQVR